MEHIGENDILNIINDNLKNIYPNAKLKNIIDKPYNYSINYYTDNITEHYEQNMFNYQLEYIQDDIKIYIREIVNLYFDKEIVIEDNILFFL
jgi:hypothetical protein